MIIRPPVLSAGSLVQSKESILLVNILYNASQYSPLYIARKGSKLSCYFVAYKNFGYMDTMWKYKKNI